MKKGIALLLVLMIVFAMAGCSKKNTHSITITIPAGSREAFVFAEEAVCPVGKKITISCGEGLGETEVLLKTVNEALTAGYVATTLVPGRPVTFDTDAGILLQIGVSVQNDTAADKTVSVTVTGVEVPKE